MIVFRENCWVNTCRKSVKQVANKYTISKNFASKPTEVSGSILLSDRIRNICIFELIFLNLADPLRLKNESKVWILIITCAVYRAMY